MWPRYRQRCFSSGVLWIWAAATFGALRVHVASGMPDPKTSQAPRAAVKEVSASVAGRFETKKWSKYASMRRTKTSRECGVLFSCLAHPIALFRRAFFHCGILTNQRVLQPSPSDCPGNTKPCCMVLPAVLRCPSNYATQIVKYSRGVMRSLNTQRKQKII